MVAGKDLRDVVLGLAFEHFRRGVDERLWSEMLEYAYQDLRRTCSKRAAPLPRIEAESADVLHSAIATMLPDAHGFEYRTYAAFISFVVKRFEWHRGTHARRAQGGVERVETREDLRSLAHEHAVAADPSQSEHAQGSELEARLDSVLADLAPDDRRIFEARVFHSASLTELARERGVHRSVIKRRIEGILRRLGWSS